MSFMTAEKAHGMPVFFKRAWRALYGQYIPVQTDLGSMRQREGPLCQPAKIFPVHTICFCCGFIPDTCGGSFLPSPHIRGISLFSYALLHQRQPEGTEILLRYFSFSSRALRSAIIVFATTFWSSSSRCLKRRKTCSSPPASFTFDTSKPIR